MTPASRSLPRYPVSAITSVGFFIHLRSKSSLSKRSRPPFRTWQTRCSNIGLGHPEFPHCKVLAGICTVRSSTNNNRHAGVLCPSAWICLHVAYRQTLSPLPLPPHFSSKMVSLGSLWSRHILDTLSCQQLACGGATMPSHPCFLATQSESPISLCQ